MGRCLQHICLFNCWKPPSSSLSCENVRYDISPCSAKPGIEETQVYASPSFAQKWASARHHTDLGSIKAPTKVESNKLKGECGWMCIHKLNKPSQLLGVSKYPQDFERYVIFIPLCWFVLVHAADLGELVHIKQQSVNSEVCISWWPLSHSILGSNRLETTKQMCKPSLVQAFQQENRSWIIYCCRTFFVAMFTLW